jgi:hypothetical protein
MVIRRNICHDKSKVKFMFNIQWTIWSIGTSVCLGKESLDHGPNNMVLTFYDVMIDTTYLFRYL